MTPNLETLLGPLRRSPQLIEAVDALQTQLARERERRQQFYEEMTPEQKIEFIDGEAILHSPAKNRHLDVTSHLSTLLNAFTQMHHLDEVKVEKCLCVFPRNDYEPDIVFFARYKAAALRPDTMKFPIPDFVVEVLSTSTEARNRGVKFEDYQAHGVRELWLIDTVKMTGEQYLMRGSAFEPTLKSGSGEIRSEVITGFAAPIKAFFDAAENLAALRAILSEGVA